MLYEPHRAASNPRSRKAKQEAGAKGGQASAQRTSGSKSSESNRGTTATPASRAKKQRAARSK